MPINRRVAVVPTPYRIAAIVRVGARPTSVLCIRSTLSLLSSTPPLGSRIPRIRTAVDATNNT